jgi:hypothetical protein
MYVVFTIEGGTCNYTEFNLLTASEAKAAALRVLYKSWFDDPLPVPSCVEWDTYVADAKSEFERRKKKIEQLHCVDLNDVVDLMIVSVKRIGV